MEFEFGSVIDGYNEMSAEDKVTAATKYVAELTEKHATEINGYKTQVSKANTEAAGYKRDLKAFREEHLTAEQKAKEAQAEKDAYFAEIEEKYKKMTYAESLRKAGYSEENAAEMATALFANDTNSIFEIMKRHTDDVSAKALADIARNTQRPPHNHEDGKNETKSKEMQIAEKLGRARADSNKISQNALDKFLKK